MAFSTLFKNAMQNPTRRPGLGASRAALLALLGAALCAPALADPQPSLAPARVFAQWGSGSFASRSATVGASWDLPARAAFLGGAATFSLDAEIGSWRARDPQGVRQSSSTQLGLSPVARWRPDGGRSPWFAEASVGANAIFPLYREGSKRFGSAFNFGDALGVGVDFGAGRRHEISLRAEHFFNGGIKEPNPGANFVQIRYAYRID